jgi:hypothetical protein
VVPVNPIVALATSPTPVFEPSLCLQVPG